MIRNQLCVKVLLFLFAHKIVESSPIFGSQTILEPKKCEDLRPFINFLMTVPEGVAMNILISDLKSIQCPTGIDELRNYLVGLVDNKMFRLRRLLQTLNVNDLNRYDLLMTILMRINHHVPLPNSIKAKLSNAILYFHGNRYLGINDYSAVKEGLCQLNLPFNNFNKGKLNIDGGLDPYEFMRFPNNPFIREGFYNEPIVIEREVTHHKPNNFRNFYGFPLGGKSTNPFSNIRQYLKYLLPPPGQLLNKPTFQKPLTDMSLIGKRPINQFSSMPIGLYPNDLLQGIRYNKPPIMFEKLRPVKLIDAPTLIQTPENVEKFVPNHGTPLIIKRPNIFQSMIPEQFRTNWLIPNRLQNRTPPEHFYNLPNFQQPFFIKQQPTGIINQCYCTSKTHEFRELTGQLKKPKITYIPKIKYKTVPEEIDETDVPNETLDDGNHGLLSLIEILPQPSNEEEKNYYEEMKGLFANPDLGNYFKDPNFGSLTSVQKLPVVLHELIVNEQYKKYLDDAKYYRDLMAQKNYGFNYFKLLDIIAGFKETEVLVDYFYTPDFLNILDKLQKIAIPMDDNDKLITILELIIQNSTNNQVIQACQFLQNHLKFQIVMSAIITLFPEPKNPEEGEKYLIVTQFLKSSDCYDLLHDMDFSVFPSDQLILEYVVNTILRSGVALEIKEAFEYYSDFTANLKNLELVRRKEIKKKFKLTEIFTDTLDLKSLNLSQKNAFKVFFKYISEINPFAISGFDSWDQAKTRGEFMKLMFKHLLESPQLDEEIKQTVLVLYPLVNMHGNGALPP